MGIGSHSGFQIGDWIMNSFIFSGLVYAIGFGGGVQTGYAIQGLMNGFNAFKSAYSAEDLRQIDSRFSKIEQKKIDRQNELELERLRIQGNLQFNLRYLEAMLERDVYSK